MPLSTTLWQTHQDLALTCLQHPFVQGLGDGSLPKAKFAYYVGQDAFFLEAFARAYSIAAAKVNDWQGFNVFHELAGGVLQELRLHQDYASRWGVDLDTVTPGAATRRYTDFLLATAWSQEVGVTAVAMLPCMRLYAFLGQSLAEQSLAGQSLATNGLAQESPEHAYSEWIRTYSSDEFEPLAERLAELADRYAVSISTSGLGSGTGLVESTYRYAMQCELDFFTAAWEHG